MSLQIRASFIGLAALTGSAMWTPAWAQSDVNLIDQRLAIAGGATPGDTPGYPITTSRPGSYRLSSNLNVPGGADGILITADGVTIDLNGSQINGTKNGDHFVGVNGGDQHRITVRNGGINNMGTGILINGSAAVIEGVTVANNAGNGIQVGEHCMISRNIVVGNSGDGIDAGRACIIS